MRAWVLHGIGDLRFETVEKPALKPGEVLVQVKAAGICGSDIPRIYQNGAHVHPLIPGHEFSGVVAEVGANVKDFKPGDKIVTLTAVDTCEVAEVGAGVDTAWLGQRVGVFPLIPCMACAPCQKEHYEMCRQYRYIGSRQDGAFAEYVAVPVWNLLRLPESVSLDRTRISGHRRHDRIRPSGIRLRNRTRRLGHRQHDRIRPPGTRTCTPRTAHRSPHGSVPAQRAWAWMCFSSV